MSDDQRVLETPRLVLRRISTDDAAFMLELLNDPAFLQLIGDRGVRTLEDARAYILSGPVASYARFGFGLNLVTLAGLGAPIGICGLLQRDTLEDPDIGFALLPAFRGQGYAIEAAAAVMEYGKRAFALERIVAVLSPGNTGSRRLLLQLGMRFERMVRLAEGGPELELMAWLAPSPTLP